MMQDDHEMLNFTVGPVMSSDAVRALFQNARVLTIDA